MASALLGDRADEFIGCHRQHASHPVLSAAEHVHQRDAIDAAPWRRSDSLRPTELSMLARAKVAPGPRA